MKVNLEVNPVLYAGLTQVLKRGTARILEETENGIFLLDTVSNGVTYETVMTNLSADEFPPAEIKHLYNLRWGIETSFRELKYTIGLKQPTSKKAEYISQEIFARCLMYNFCELVTSHVAIHYQSEKYVYQTNFSAAVHICRLFLRGSVVPPDAETNISRNLVPVRPNRKAPRNLNRPRFNGFLNKVA